MKRIKLIIAFFALFTGFTASAQQDSTKEGGLVWYTNLMEANAASEATNKPIFGFFTGSDWCGWCKKLQRDVFAKPAFIEWAKENVILLELDFPRYTKLNEELAQQNASLQQAFQVRGYPTIWLFTMSNEADPANYVISAIGSCGYPSGAEKGKEEVKFLDTVNAFLKKEE